MRRFYLAAAMCLAAAIALPSCAQLSAALTVGTSASVTRTQAIVLIDTTKTLQDLATSYMNGCVAAQSITGACAPTAVRAINKALVATQDPRKQLAAFAQAHAGAQLGASGLYAALLAAKNSLASVLTQYGYSVPTT